MDESEDLGVDGKWVNSFNGAWRSLRDPAFLHFCNRHATCVTKSRTRIGPWRKLLIRGWPPWAIGASEFMTFIFQHGCLGHRATKSARLEGRPRSVVSSSLPSVVAVAEWAPFWDGFNLSMPLKREGGGKSVLERRQNLITRELWLKSTDTFNHT